MVLTWFRDGHLISSLDFAFPLDRAKEFHRDLYIWDELYGLGRVGAQSMSYFIPYGLFLGLTQVLGLSLLATEKILFYIWFTGSGLSMYYLVSVVMEGRREKTLAATMAAVFYMLNPFALIFIWPNLTLAPFFISFFPLVLGLFIKGLKEGRGFKFAFLVCIVWLLTINGSNSAIRWGIFAWLILLSYFVFHVLTVSRRLKWRASQFLIALVLIWLGLNAWWLIGLGSQATEVFGGSALSVQGQMTDISLYRMSSASVADAMRLGGWWALGEGYKVDPFYTWGSTYLTTPFVALSFLIPFLAFVGLVFKKRPKDLLFFALLALGGIFLIKGLNQPLGQVNKLIISNGMLVRLIRNVYWYIGPFVMLGYAVLIGWSVSLVYYRVKETGTVWFKRSVCPVMGKALLLCVVVLLFGVYAYPFWTGTIIYPGGKVIPSYHYDVPEYYREANDWLKTLDGDFRLFSLPFATSGNPEVMDWEHGYFGAALTPWLLERPVVSSANATSGGNLALEIATMLTDSKVQTNEVGRMLALLDVRYVVLHRDANWQYIEGHPWWISTSLQQYQINLSNQEGLELERSFGGLDFYRNEYWQPLQVYATPNVIPVSGSIDKMFEVVSSDSFTPGESVVLLSEQVTSSQWQFIQEYSAGSSSYAADISFQKVNPTKYQVKITNATEPFFLVFSDSYHPQWKAYVNSQGGDTNWMEAFFQESIPSESHLIANGYANAWYIDPGKLGTGAEFSVTLYFQPQSSFYLGWIISGLALVGCIGFLVWRWRRGRRLKTRRDRV